MSAIHTLEVVSNRVNPENLPASHSAGCAQTWRDFVRSQGIDPSTLHPTARELGAMLDRVRAKGWGMRQKTPPEEVELIPRLLAEQSRKRAKKARAEGRESRRAWSLSRYKQTIREEVEAGRLIVTRSKKNQPRLYRPAWWDAPDPTSERPANDQRATSETTSEVPDNSKPRKTIDPIRKRTGRGERFDGLTKERREEELKPTPERSPTHSRDRAAESKQASQPIEIDQGKEPEIPSEIVTLAEQVAKRYPTYPDALKREIQRKLKAGIDPEIIAFALIRVLEVEPNWPIGLLQRIVRDTKHVPTPRRTKAQRTHDAIREVAERRGIISTEIPNSREIFAEMESRTDRSREMRELVASLAKPEPKRLPPPPKEDPAEKAEREWIEREEAQKRADWEAAKTIINGAFKLAGEDEQRHAELARAYRDLDAKRVESLHAEWSGAA